MSNAVIEVIKKLVNQYNQQRWKGYYKDAERTRRIIHEVIQIGAREDGRA